MTRPTVLLSAFVCLLAVAALATTPVIYVPRENTRKAVMTYVENAAAVVGKSGPSCATFETSPWRGSDYYIFVIGPDDKLICHVNTAMIGKLQSEIVNSHGDKVGERIVKMGAGKGKGWVEYVWPRPGKTADEPKSSYVMGVTGPGGKHYVVGAGAYDLK